MINEYYFIKKKHDENRLFSIEHYEEKYDNYKKKVEHQVLQLTNDC